MALTTRPDVNSFRIDSNDPDITFRAKFGDGAPLVIDGYGGWTVTQRPRNIGITEWVGRNPVAVEIPFMIDKWITIPDANNPSELVESQVKKLERLSGVGSDEEPPVCKVDGHGVIPFDQEYKPQWKWVIENVTWDRGIEIRSGTNEGRLRAGGTLVIRQLVRSDPLERQKRGKNQTKKNQDKGKKHPRFYIVKNGDSLTKIAVKMYGDAKKWKKIAEANNLRDPRHIKVGRKLRIP